MALCLELLNTSGWAREGAWDDSRFSDSLSADDGVFPSRTARSILGEEGKGAEVKRELRHVAILPPASQFVALISQICTTLTRNGQEQLKRPEGKQGSVFQSVSSANLTPQKCSQIGRTSSRA